MDLSADPATSFLKSLERRSDFLENVILTCPEGIMANDTKGNIFLYNRSAEGIFGYTKEEIIGKVNAKYIYPPGGAKEVRDYIYSTQYGPPGHLVDFETEILRKDGQKTPIRLCCSVLRENGTDIGYIGFFTDISARKALLRSLERRSAFLENVISTCPEGIIANDTRGTIFLYNKSAEGIFGYTEEEVIGGKLHAKQLYPPGGAKEVREYIYSTHFGPHGHLVDFETEVLRKNGKKAPIRLCCSVLRENEKDIGYIGFFTDISARIALQAKFLESEERFRGIFESAHDAIVSVREDGMVVMANRAAQELLGYDEETLLGMKAIRLFAPRFADYWRELSTYASRLGPGNERRNIEIVALSKSGAEIPIQLTLAEKIVRGEKIQTAILRDISERKALEESLRLQSITDTLTDLYNRRHFHSLAQNEAERAVRSRVPFSILLMDVDRFKQYNDAFGHDEGDKVLRALGDEIRKNFRTMDTGFRHGGEEFLVLLPETTSEDAIIAAERLRTRFATIPFLPNPEEEPRKVTLSIGIAEFRPGLSIDDLVRAADRAMYSAKNAGRNRTVSHEHLVPLSDA
jgi:diguanylate cyclase (GGDEF)-like protein/PAS domain S-box-containing protein